MQITEIKVGELCSFVESEQYKQFNPKPITGLRAISQYHNPDAQASDTALIIAHEEATVLGFIGLLPRNTNETHLHVYSNTCWWSNPHKGKGVALPLLFLAMKRFDSNMYLTDCTLYTRSILEKTRHFVFLEPQQGIRGFLRFYFADLFAKKYRNLNRVKKLLSFGDSVLNLFWSPIRLYFLKKYRKSKLAFIPVEKLDEAMEEFIKTRSKHEFIRRTSAYFEWVRKYPWVRESSDGEPCEYPFSHVVKRYSLDYFELKKDGELKAFVAVSVRDNLAKIPYIYFDQEDLPEVMHSVFWFLLKKKCDSVVVFHPAVVEFMNVNKTPFIFSQKEQKIVGASKTLYPFFAEKSFLQDGDGDFIFS